MKSISSVIDRVAQVVVWIASTWFVFAAVWGMFGIPGGGHIGAGSAASTMLSEQIVRWKILYPAWGFYTGVAPSQADYIGHHPFGTNYIAAFFLWIFGHRDFVVHLPAVVMSAFIPPLLYGIGKAGWGRSIGAVVAAAYVVVPVAVGFSNFAALETPCIFGALLFFWGHSRHMSTGKERHLLASLLGLGVACMGDWPGYLITAPTLAWGLLRAFILPARLTPSMPMFRYARWWALSVALAGSCLVFSLGLFHHSGHIGDLLAAAGIRSAGSEAKLEDVLKARAHWIDFSLTPLAIAIGKIAAPVCFLRWIVKRHDEETYSLGFLFGATIHYVVFKQGADVHTFWSHYFAPYFALSLGQLVATVASGVGWRVRRSSPSRAAEAAAGTGLVLGLLPVIAMAHDGVRALWIWRQTGGRYDENGSLIRSHIDMLSVLERVVVPYTARDGRIDVHPSAQFGWEHQWKCQANPTTVDRPVIGGPGIETHPFWIARASGMSKDEKIAVAGMAHARIYGDTWIVDQRERAAPLDVYSLNEREPNPIEWLLCSGTEPMRSIGPDPDPWLTWEWRRHLGQTAQPPAGDPVTLDEMRIAHNVAVDRDDPAAAKRWRDRVEAEIDRTVETRFTQGIHLIGVRVTRGVQPRLEAWFECTEKRVEGSPWFHVRSTVEARDPLSTIPPDPIDREMAWPPLLSTGLWHGGFIYKTEAVLHHRIGRERYWGYWAPTDQARAPQRMDGAVETTLAVLP